MKAERNENCRKIETNVYISFNKCLKIPSFVFNKYDNFIPPAIARGTPKQGTVRVPG